MTQGDIVNKASSQVGYHEKEANTPTNYLYQFQNSYDGSDNWTKYHHDLSVGQGVAWCGYFCYWVFYQLLGQSFVNTDNFLHGISGRGGGVDAWESAFSNAGYYFPKGSYVPVPGDVVIFSSTDYTWSHCEIVADVTEWPNYIMTVGGNTTNPNEGGDQSQGLWVASRRRSVTASSVFWIRGFCSIDAQSGTSSSAIIFKHRRIGTAFG